MTERREPPRVEGGNERESHAAVLSTFGSESGRPRRAYLVGGGIASLAAAAYLIRDGGFPGDAITIIEAAEVFGGALDGGGSPETGYIIRGGRMLNDEAYAATYDLLSFIPSLSDPGKSVLDEVREFNEEVRSHSRARLVRAGEKLDASDFGLSNRDRLDLAELMARSEESLGAQRIEDFFQPSFFQTNFWFMWATTFAFQPWHSLAECKRYLHRFIHAVPWFSTLSGVRRTRYNQYDAVVVPLTRWLESCGVRFLLGTQAADVAFRRGPGGKTVERLDCRRDGGPLEIAVAPDDLVLITLGSMVAATSFGSMTAAPRLEPWNDNGAWSLWETLAEANPEFGHPAVFNGDIDGSKWLSFTVTLHDPTFFDLMERFTGNEAGTGGLVTLTDSSWLMSVVLARQPHFLHQPESVKVFWGYGLFIDQPGDFVGTKMSESTGEEIMVELLRHLRFDAHIPSILASATCIPALMPFITSQFMPRVKGDRPPVIPPGTANLAFIGQFCEIPDDVVFTVDYSVRSAQTAVYGLLDLDREVTPIYKGGHDLRVLLGAAKTMMA